VADVDTVELGLGGVAGVLTVVLAYGFFFASVETPLIAGGVVVLVALVVGGASRRRRVR